MASTCVSFGPEIIKDGFTVTLSRIEKYIKRVGAFLKNAWNKEPVIVASCGIGILGLIIPFVSPYTKYTTMMNAAVPYNYPVPLRDDGNMPDVPVHPSEPKGRSLEWIKKL